MSNPASARVVPISEIKASDVGTKFRVFGILLLPQDPTSTIVQVHSFGAAATGKAGHKTGKRDNSLGILVDISLCVDDDAKADLRENGCAVMAMGTLEPYTDEGGFSETWAGLVDPSIVLRAILLKDASDVDLAAMEAAICRRREFEQAL